VKVLTSSIGSCRQKSIAIPECVSVSVVFLFLLIPSLVLINPQAKRGEGFGATWRVERVENPLRQVLHESKRETFASTLT